MKRLLSIIAAVLVSVGSCLPSRADATRTSSWGNRPYRRLATQFAGNVFVTADPSPAGTPLTLTSATGIGGPDGTVSIGMGAGFTAPVTLTVYYWQLDSVVPANSCWQRLGPAAANYSTAIDTNYASVTFTVPAGTPFLIRSSAAVTGNVYTDARAAFENNNSAATGY